MEFYDTVENRHTHREFTGEVIDSETLEKIIARGIKAPSNDHLRQWEFVVLKTEDELENGLKYVLEFSQSHTKWGTEGKADATVRDRMYEHAMPRQYTMLKNTGCVVIPFFKAGPKLFTPEAVNHLNSIASIWCVNENIFLRAADEGYGCAVRIPVGDEGENVRKALGVPEGYVMACYIGIGRPSESEIKVTQTPADAKSKIHTGRW